jgi:hypothetical protein
MVDHVALAGDDGELASGHFMVKARGVPPDIDDLVILSCDDDHGHTQFSIVGPQLYDRWRHQGGVFRRCAKLARP